MARQRRLTEPLETIHGVLTSYDEIELRLAEGEVRGIEWVYGRRGTRPTRTAPQDEDILALHRAMFADVLPWAGETRKKDCGPGGKVPVSWWNVPIELRKFGQDVQIWVEAAGADPGITEIATVVADAHHRFQWVHPFQDTNGRTGRVVDLYLLWGTFGLVGADLSTSPIIEPFPTEAEEDDYYVGLQEADGGSPDRLRRYYATRIVAAFQTLAKPSVSPPPGSTPVPSAK